jgi:hypothetical protein
MKVYWVYEISTSCDGGTAIHRTDIHCASDEDAKKQAKALAVRNAVELWEGRRRLARFEAP